MSSVKPEDRTDLDVLTQHPSGSHAEVQSSCLHRDAPQALFSPCLAEAGSGQDYVSSETQLLYYPSITYAIIGSSIIFVLVVAFLALVLHHQRKRNNLMALPVQRLQHPVLLSRLVVLDHPHHCSVTYNVSNGLQCVPAQPYPSPPDLSSPPSYSEAVLDQRYGQHLAALFGCAPALCCGRSTAWQLCHGHRAVPELLPVERPLLDPVVPAVLRRSLSLWCSGLLSVTGVKGI